MSRLRLAAMVGILVAIAAVLIVSPASAKPKPVKPGEFFTVSCPAGQLGQGGAVSWYDRSNAVISSSTGTPSGGSVRFGPAPKKAAFAIVTILNCSAPVTTTTVGATTTSSSTTTSTTQAPTTTTTLAPTTTTTIAPTTTTTPDTNVYLTGSVFVTDQGAFIIGDPSIPGVTNCPVGYTADFAQSTFTHPSNITITDWTQLFVPPTIFAVADDLTTGTVTYRVACRKL